MRKLHMDVVEIESFATSDSLPTDEATIHGYNTGDTCKDATCGGKFTCRASCDCETYTPGTCGR